MVDLIRDFVKDNNTKSIKIVDKQDVRTNHEEMKITIGPKILQPQTKS